MKLLAHFLADSASFNQDGTFTVFKGGVNEIQSPAFPTMAKIAVITSLEFTIEEAAARLHQLQLNITLPGGTMIQGPRQPVAVRVLDVSRGRVYSNVIAEMHIGIPIPGDVIISGALDDMALPLLFLTAVAVRPI